MLLSLTLSNFKRHRSLAVNFVSGTNGIFGPNYAGKSTLFYAILFALGGSSHVPGTRLVHRSAEGKFEVALEFAIGGKTYKVVRGKTSANLYCGDELVASAATAVTTKIEELIGMSIKQWKELHFAKQKNAHSLLRYSAGNLHALMRRLVGAEELDAVMAKLKTMSSHNKGRLEGLQAHQVGDQAKDYPALRAEMEKRVKELAERWLMHEEEVKRLVESETQGNEAIAKVRDALDGLVQAKADTESHQTKMEAAAGRLERAKVTLGKAQGQHDAQLSALEAFGTFDPKEALKEVQEYEQAKDTLIRAELRHEQAKKGLLDASDALAQQQGRLKLATEHLNEVVKEVGMSLETATSNRDDLATRVAAIQGKVVNLQDAIAGSACPTCRRPFEDHDPEALAKELAEAEAEEDVCVQEWEVAGRAVTQLTSAHNAHRRAGEPIVELEDRLKAAERESDAAHHALQQAQIVDSSSIDELRQKVTLFNQAKVSYSDTLRPLADAKDEVSEASDALLAVQKKAAAGHSFTVAELVEKIEAARGKLVRYQSRMTELKNALVSERNLLEEAALQRGLTERSLAKIADDEERDKAQREGLERALKKQARIEALQKYLKQNAEQYMNRAWSTFMAHASQFAQLCTGGDIEALDRTEDGDFIFMEEGSKMSLDEASGAQEAIIGLAIQLALASAAPCHLNVLMLDEPTADMDPDRSLASMAALSTLGSQVIFVSHQQGDNAICDNAISLG